MAMISRALLRLRSPATISLIRILGINGASHLSSSAAIHPGLAAAQAHSYSVAASLDTTEAGARKAARLSTVTWSPQLHNSVSFIGTVEFPLRKYASKDERFGVYTSLRVNTSPDSDTSFWITLVMWDELAERALLHLKQNDYIYISGELGSYMKATVEGKESIRYKVTAKELNYVKLDEPGKLSQRAANPEKETGEPSLQKKNNRLHLWQLLFGNPNEWYDNRTSKKNPKQPDFKHKSTGEVLWFSERDPPWVKKQLILLDSRYSGGENYGVSSKYSPSSLLSDELFMVPNRTVTEKELNDAKPDESAKIFQRVVNSDKEIGDGKSSLQKKNDRLHLWKKFIANPDEWYDNRKSKKNPKQPDFKHKSSGEALWFSERDPLWVKEQIELLDSRLVGGAVNEAKSNSSSTKFESGEPLKEVRAEELTLDEPGENFKSIESSGSEICEGKSSLQKKNDRLHLWKKFIANPDEWYDNRKSKKNPKQPDFKHKSSGEALWFSERDPLWVKEQIELLDSRLVGGADNEAKSNSSSTKFESGEPLKEVRAEELTLDEPGENFKSIESSGSEICEGKSSLQKKNDRLHLWKKFIANPDEWYDNRKSRKNPKQPDFKHKSSGEALWFSERDPLWVKEQIELLDSRLVGGADNEAKSKSSQTKWVSDELLAELNLNVAAEELTLDEPRENFQSVEYSGSETRKSKSRVPKKLWKKLFANPDEWYDNRKSKKNPKQPDFKHKSSGEALWLDGCDSPWVKKQIKILDSGISREPING